MLKENGCSINEYMSNTSDVVLNLTFQAVTGPLGAVLTSTLSEAIGWFWMFALASAFTMIGKHKSSFLNKYIPELWAAASKHNKMSEQGHSRE